MSDKEERIYITEVKEGDVCPFEENCEGFYKLCEGCNVLPTRQEAIERMAKGLCSENLSHSCEDCMRNGTNDCFINEKEDFYKSLAEAALNSLLEDK